MEYRHDLPGALQGGPHLHGERVEVAVAVRGQNHDDVETRFAHQQNGTQSEHVERVAFEFRSGVGVEPRVPGLRAAGCGP